MFRCLIGTPQMFVMRVDVWKVRIFLHDLRLSIPIIRTSVLIIISWSIRNSFLPVSLKQCGVRCGRIVSMGRQRKPFTGDTVEVGSGPRRTEERPGIAMWFPWTGDAWTFPPMMSGPFARKESFEEPILRGCYVTKNLPLMCKILLTSHSNSTRLHHPGLVFLPRKWA